MVERTAIEVTVDDSGKVTVHLHEVTEVVRRAALTAVSRALGEVEQGAGDELLTDEEWRRAWDAELARRVAQIDSGAAHWVSLDDARLRLRAAAQRQL